MRENIFDLFVDTQDYIYHYTSAETALLYILPQKRLLFSSLANTNDPRENRWHITACVDDAEIGEADSISSRMHDIADGILKNTYIMCFSQDNKVSQEPPYFMEKGFRKFRMWAQYANNHKGVCLAFRKELLLEKFNSTYMGMPHFSGDIDYLSFLGTQMRNYEAFTLMSSELSKQDEIIVADRIDKYHRAYYFCKHLDWKEENEFRFVIRTDSEKKQYLDIDGALEEIILGEGFDESQLDLVEMLANNFHYKPAFVKPYLQ